MVHIELTITRRHLTILIGILLAGLMLIPGVAGASHTFEDVDDDNVFHADIDWLAAAGVTKGCNPPDNTMFCPGSPVTREQMAAFMHRLSDGESDTLEHDHDADYLAKTGKAVDADKVDGKHATDIAPIAVADVDETFSANSAAVPTTINAVSITVESSGVLIISGGAYVGVAESGFFAFETYVDGTEIGEFSTFDAFSLAPGSADSTESMSYTTAAAVTPGTHVVQQRLGKMDPTTGELINGSFVYNANSLSVLFIPGGTVTAATAGSSSGGSLDGS
jgi:hypothetical protein